MPIKIEGLQKFEKKLNRLVPNIKNNFAKEGKREIVDIIVEKVVSGVSPVKGHGRYKDYSPGYAKTKGRRSPVDLTVTGKMLNAMVAFQTRAGDLVIEIRSKIAQYHNDKSKARVFRPILPTRNRTFTDDIMNKIIKILRKAVKKSV